MHFIWLLWLSLAAALSPNLCSSQNLASDSDASTYNYMSNGWCHDNCKDSGYAVAITQDYDCWCSNDVPEDTVSIDECSTGCPGISSEKCGGDGYFGYVIISTPSATQGSETSETSTSTSKSSSSKTSKTTEDDVSTLVEQVKTTIEVSQTVQVTETYQETHTQDTQLTESEESSVSATADSSSSDSSSSSGSSSSYASVIYSVKTVNGSTTQIIKTEYVTATPSPPPASATTSASSSALASSSATSGSKSKSKSSFFDSKGKVAGTFTAVGLVVLGLVSGILYCCCCCGGKRDHDDFTDEENQYSSDELSLSNEKAAVPASFAMNDTSKHSSGPPSPNLKRNSSGKSLFTLLSPGGAGGTSGVARSLSRKKLNPSKDHTNHDMMFPISEFDSRLDPRTMFLNSNESSKTLEDEHDYSRRILHITNPE